MKPKITIAIPCMDMIETEFVKCVTALRHVGDCRLDFHAGSLVYAARDQLAAKAIEDNSDYILWLDSDMVFEPDLLEKLYADLQEEDSEYVAALFFKRRPPHDTCLYKKIRMGLPGESITEDYNDYPEDAVFPIDASGFGAVLMKTSLVKDIVDEFHTAFMPIPGYGEDISFCIRAKKLGHELYCDSRVKVGHITRTVVDEDTFRFIHKEEEEGHGKNSDGN